MADASLPRFRTFLVSPDLPPSLQPLMELSKNLWWVWHPDAIELFRRLDRQLWDSVYHNPVKLLGTISQERLLKFAQDEGYLAHMKRTYDAFREDMEQTGWFQLTHPNPQTTSVPSETTVPTAATPIPRLAAYFSAEFGIHESLPIYSGGLGILAGDHLKSASEIGLPLVGVGLLYRNGYFQQYLTADGWQQESYPELDFYNLPVEPMRHPDGSPVKVQVEMPDNTVQIQIWKAQVGRIPLFLLDTNLAENSPADRDITSRLYGGGTEMRIRQEIVLGIGGVRALAALQVVPAVFHMNEGHSAFLALERIRVLLANNGNIKFDEARQLVMGSCVFTTHTPVPAGIDHFEPELLLKYFKSYIPGLKLDDEGFLALGRENVYERKSGFSMAVLAIRLSDFYNGVSELHGEVSREMWHMLWPKVPAKEVPIKHVTNGIHVRSWLSAELTFTLDRYLGGAWASSPADQTVWSGVDTIPDEELWRAHERSRERLVSFTRGRLHDQLTRRGGTYDDLATANEVLDPDALTIGFARRFATYKRGALLLRDPARLKRLIEDAKRPIQFIFAGKAHPADNDGKELIKTVVNFARDPALRRRFVFLENYDMNVARFMVQGVDVWLNTPRRPYEASGTSGMKAAANGVLNCSILDGWWVEGYTPDVGWAIGRGEMYGDPNTQDQLEGQALYDLLEKQIVPLFYDRTADGLPREWVGRMKACMRKLIPVFNTNRMVRQYAEQMYLHAEERGKKLASENLKSAVDLANAKISLRSKWPGVSVVAVQSSGNGHYKVGDAMNVDAMLDLPGIDPALVQVQMFCGPINASGEIEQPQVLAMEHVRAISNDRHMFTGTIRCQSSGRQGYAIRIVPGLPNQATPFEPGLIAWN